MAIAFPARSAEFRTVIGAADGLLISSPEYARGVAGVMKNALDWLVASFEFPNKPVALINTSPRATHALAALTSRWRRCRRGWFRTRRSRCHLLGTSTTPPAVANAAFAAPLRSALERYIEAIRAFARDEA